MASSPLRGDRLAPALELFGVVGRTTLAACQSHAAPTSGSVAIDLGRPLSAEPGSTEAFSVGAHPAATVAISFAFCSDATVAIGLG